MKFLTRTRENQLIGYFSKFGEVEDWEQSENEYNSWLSLYFETLDATIYFDAEKDFSLKSVSLDYRVSKKTSLAKTDEIEDDLGLKKAINEFDILVKKLKGLREGE